MSGEWAPAAYWVRGEGDAKDCQWGKPGGRSLYDQAVTILGGGGIARTLIGLLALLRVHVTVVRRHPDPVPGAERVLATAQLSEALPGALVIFLALVARIAANAAHFAAGQPLDGLIDANAGY